MRRYFLLVIYVLLGVMAMATPKYEMRAVWITTNWGLDWPKQPATDSRSIAMQQRDLRAMLDEVVSMGLNTVFFQARIRGEVFYASDIEPWSYIVSGTSGVSPGYDPLEFVIEECHRRGLECHAWLVTVPVGSVKQVQRQGKKSLPQRRPELCVKLKGEWYLNPGHPQAADYVASIAREIATRYAIDGIHFDYIRYPSECGNFPDAATYRQYAPEGVSIEAWRIDNITRLVETVSREIKSIDKSIMVSTAPLGRYASLGDNPAEGFVCIGGASQDAVAWLAYGYNDFIAPMIYYKDDNYFPYVADWQQRVGEQGGVVAGLGAYRMDKGEGNWSLADLDSQIAATRRHAMAGQAYFRFQHLHNYASLAQLLKEKYYQHPALIPPMRTADEPEIAPIQAVQLHNGATADTLSWQPVAGAVRYAVYASAANSVDATDAAQLVATWVTDSRYIVPAGAYRSYAVTAIDAYRRESEPCCVIP